MGAGTRGDLDGFVGAFRLTQIGCPEPGRKQIKKTQINKSIKKCFYLFINLLTPYRRWTIENDAFVVPGQLHSGDIRLNKILFSHSQTFSSNNNSTDLKQVITSISKTLIKFIN